ncbi:MAG: ABC transporter substrate-binding protein [Gammaproteobacteria bacterium]|nr:ABC transporter substrate-binding protein [Gammaproteobacteria bacterium]
MTSNQKTKIIAPVAALVVLASTVAIAAPEKPLTVVSWGGSYTRSQMLAYVKPYREANNEWVQMETYNGGLQEIRRQVETANVVWDVVDFELSDLIRGCREGLLEKIDHSKLPAGADGTPAAQDFIDGAFTECGVGQTVWSTVVGYNADRFNEGRPSRLADFFDIVKYPGGRGIRRDPRVIMEWALMADGVAPKDVYSTLATEQGQKRAFAVMDRIKTKIVWWASGEEPVKLLDSGAVSMTSVWNGRMHRPIAEQSKPYAIVWDGQIWDIDSWGIPKGAYNLEKAMDFIRFSTSTQQLAEQTKYITYGPARKSSLVMVSDQTKRLLPTAPENMGNALQTDADWWADRHVAMRAKFEQWLASGRGLSGTAR